MTASVRAADSSGDLVSLQPVPLAHGGITTGGNSPRVAIVIRSDSGIIHSNEGAYMGFLELTAREANILGEELRKAAEKAANNKEDA